MTQLTIPSNLIAATRHWRMAGPAISITTSVALLLFGNDAGSGTKVQDKWATRAFSLGAFLSLITFIDAAHSKVIFFGRFGTERVIAPCFSMLGALQIYLNDNDVHKLQLEASITIVSGMGWSLISLLKPSPMKVANLSALAFNGFHLYQGWKTPKQASPRIPVIMGISLMILHQTVGLYQSRHLLSEKATHLTTLSEVGIGILATCSYFLGCRLKNK